MLSIWNLSYLLEDLDLNGGDNVSDMSVEELTKLLEQKKKFPEGEKSTTSPGTNSSQTEEISVDIQVTKGTGTIHPAGHIRYPKWYLKQRPNKRRWKR